MTNEGSRGGDRHEGDGHDGDDGDAERGRNGGRGGNHGCHGPHDGGGRDRGGGGRRGEDGDVGRDGDGRSGGEEDGGGGSVRGERRDEGIDALRARLVAFAEARHWGRYHTPKNLASALSVEASELMEVFQWLTPEESARVMDDPGSAHRVEDEIADVLAYLLQLCAVLGVDPLKALSAKIDRNEGRFPLP